MCERTVSKLCIFIFVFFLEEGGVVFLEGARVRYMGGTVLACTWEVFFLRCVCVELEVGFRGFFLL